ncbi:MAG: o-succinylbenzoate--CoA ligase, partial [Verrucomicrobia bacterium]|nr:o-succinylbenzoate--CoA ligase [Verrucomicrobiota bacterium]
MERTELEKLIRATGGAEERGEMFFLCDPAWREREMARIEAPTGPVADGWLAVPTGGTSGGVRFARHDERTLTAAVEGFCGHFDLGRVNAVGVLPAYHVSGLMARVRCAETGGEHVAWDWKRLEAGERPALKAGGEWVISLVPTQLQRLLTTEAAVAWLRGFHM